MQQHHREQDGKAHAHDQLHPALVQIEDVHAHLHAESADQHRDQIGDQHICFHVVRAQQQSLDPDEQRPHDQQEDDAHQAEEPVHGHRLAHRDQRANEVGLSDGGHLHGAGQLVQVVHGHKLAVGQVGDQLENVRVGAVYADGADGNVHGQRIAEDAAQPVVAEHAVRHQDDPRRIAGPESAAADVILHIAQGLHHIGQSAAGQIQLHGRRRGGGLDILQQLALIGKGVHREGIIRVAVGHHLPNRLLPQMLGVGNGAGVIDHEDIGAAFRCFDADRAGIDQLEQARQDEDPQGHQRSKGVILFRRHSESPGDRAEPCDQDQHHSQSAEIDGDHQRRPDLAQHELHQRSAQEHPDRACQNRQDQRDPVKLASLFLHMHSPFLLLPVHETLKLMAWNMSSLEYSV